MARTYRHPKTDPDEQPFPYVPVNPTVTAAEICQADVRLRLVDKYPEFAAALDGAVEALEPGVAWQRSELAVLAGGL